MRNYAFTFTGGSTTDLSNPINYVQHEIPMLSATITNTYSTGINTENTMVLLNNNQADFIIMDRFNCYGSQDPLNKERCVGCSGPAA